MGDNKKTMNRISEIERSQTTNQVMNEKIISAYEAMAEKYNELIDTKPHNAYYDRPNTLQLLPGLAGKKILDTGCWPGKYAEILMEQGAMVTGFDISPKMIALAIERNKGKGEFFVHDLADSLNMLADNSIDIVLCALVLQYVQDWPLTIKEFYRVLKKRWNTCNINRASFL